MHFKGLQHETLSDISPSYVISVTCNASFCRTIRAEPPKAPLLLLTMKWRIFSSHACPVFGREHLLDSLVQTIRAVRHHERGSAGNHSVIVVIEVLLLRLQRGKNEWKALITASSVRSKTLFGLIMFWLVKYYLLHWPTFQEWAEGLDEQGYAASKKQTKYDGKVMQRIFKSIFMSPMSIF